MFCSHSHLVWEEIDLSHIADNVKELKKIVRNGIKFMAVVKADGYGHGAVESAKAALKSGADMLGVARLGEAVALRYAHIKSPILIFGRVPYQMASGLLEYDLTATVFDYGMARALSEFARGEGQRIKIHIKIDTGMGRVGIIANKELGFPLEKVVDEVKEIKKLEGIDLKGIYTHFATADEKDKSYVKNQFRIFSGCLKGVKDAGIHIEMQHCANSAALIDLPETHLDLVRPGIAIYGLYPSEWVDQNKILLKPALSLKTRIIQLKRVPARFKVSYGCTFETPQESILATVPVGYADGYSRLFSSKGEMLVRGKRAKVVGRVCMDQLVLDVTHIKDVALDDEVVIIGTQDEETILADELAVKAETIHYEIVSSILARVPKIYKYESCKSSSGMISSAEFKDKIR